MAPIQTTAVAPIQITVAPTWFIPVARSAATEGVWQSSSPPPSTSSSRWSSSEEPLLPLLVLPNMAVICVGPLLAVVCMGGWR